MFVGAQWLARSLQCQTQPLSRSARGRVKHFSLRRKCTNPPSQRSGNIRLSNARNKPMHGVYTFLCYSLWVINITTYIKYYIKCVILFKLWAETHLMTAEFVDVSFCVHGVSCQSNSSARAEFSSFLVICARLINMDVVLVYISLFWVLCKSISL